MQNIRQIHPGVYQYHCLHFSPQELADAQLLQRLAQQRNRDLARIHAKYAKMFADNDPFRV